MAGIVIDDSVKAEIEPTDLYSLIYPVKEAHFNGYGRHSNSDYKRKMLALAEGKPQQRLQEYRLAREIVRAILTGKQWIALEGEGIPIRTAGATTFPTVPDKELREHLYGLIEDGLLDMYVQCHSANRWALESEFVWQEDTVSLIENSKLREGIVKMLKPFESEKPIYIHSR